MDRLTDLCLRHKRFVALAWLVLTLVGLGFAGSLAKRLDQDFSLPGQKAYETNEAIYHAYGDGGNSTPIVVVVTDPAGSLDTGSARAAIVAGLRRAAALGKPHPWRVLYPGTDGTPGSVVGTAARDRRGDRSAVVVV